MEYIFRKDKMLQRLKAEGQEDKISEELIEIMDSIDGCEVKKNIYKVLVYNIEEGVIETEKYGNLAVELRDCDTI